MEDVRYANIVDISNIGFAGEGEGEGEGVSVTLNVYGRRARHNCCICTRERGALI